MCARFKTVINNNVKRIVQMVDVTFEMCSIATENNFIPKHWTSLCFVVSKHRVGQVQ